MVEKVLIISLIVFAIYTSMQEGMIFGKLGNWFEWHIKSEYWQKPLFSCVVCMAGIYGAIIYWAIWGAEFLIFKLFFFSYFIVHIFLIKADIPMHILKEWIIVNISAIGLNAILSKIIPDE